MALTLNLLYLVLLLIIIFTAIMFWTMVMTFWTRVPFARTPSKNIARALAELNLPAGAKVYDLGCGDGSTLFLAEKAGCRAIGYELSPYPYCLARLKKFLNKSKVKIYHSSFFKADLKPADAIYMFLIASIMPKVGEKLKASLKPGTPVISYGFTLPGWQPVKILDTTPSKTYIYRA